MTKLKFIHITKTSGTYIEDIAKKKKINWGRYDQLRKKLIKSSPKTLNPFWHVPYAYSNEYLKVKYYPENIKTFTVVRNPYDRIVSECQCVFGCKYIKNRSIEDVESMNKYIEKILSTLNTFTKENTHWYHFFPQHKYTHSSKGKKIIDHIIKYEEIDEFNRLMKQYSIDLHYNSKKESSKKRFTIHDISEENIKLINKMYHLDFLYFGYKKINN